MFLKLLKAGWKLSQKIIDEYNLWEERKDGLKNLDFFININIIGHIKCLKKEVINEEVII